MSGIRLSTSISLMFRETPILERFAAAKAAGFDGVEIQLLEEGEPAALAAAARAAGVEVVLINVDMGDWRAGGPGLSGVPGREAVFRDAVARALDSAAALGAKLIHLGPSRVPPETTRTACLDTYRANLAAAVSMAAGRPVTLVIEPLNRVESPTVLLQDFEEADRLVAAAGSQVGLQFDLYHAALNELDILAAFRQSLPRIRHLQFSDAPGRHQPGTGRIDFAAILPALAASGYRGWLGAEYFPEGPTSGSFGWLPTFRTLLTP